MKERPIFFNDEMVRAILDGSKTQTRRIIKPGLVAQFDMPDIEAGYPFIEIDDGHVSTVYLCPFGKVGDRLLVRECFATLDAGSHEPVKACLGMNQDVRYRATDYLAKLEKDVRGYGWNPSIHMPRWASRITLEITNVRVERLQGISEEDAIAEGLHSNEEYKDSAGCVRLFDCPVCSGDQVYEAQGMGGAYELNCTFCDTAAKRFSLLWQSIYGEKSWNSNPWAWAIEFKRITP